MKLRDIVRQATRSDPTWVDPFTESKAQFDFAATDSSDWPIAGWSAGLQDAARLGALGAGSYSAIYRSQPSIYTVTEFLAWQVSQVGLKVYHREEDGEKTPLPESEIARLLRRPAEGLTYERLIHSLVADLCVFGNAYWLKAESKNGMERAIVPLRPQWVSPRGGGAIQASSYRVSTPGGLPTDFPAEQVLHFRRFNPDDPRIGVSPLEPLRLILAEEREAGADRVGFWANKARIGGILKHPGRMSDEAYARLQTSWKASYTGADKSNETAILEEDTDFKETSFSPKDAEFIAGRKLTLETVARALNVPVSVLGLSEHATFASQKEFHKALYQDTLGPWFAFLEGEVRRGLVSWFTDDPDVYVEFNIAEKLKGSFEEQAEALRSWVGVPPMSVNEWRARYNLPKIDDPQFDLPVMPANVAYGGVGLNGDAPMPELPDRPGQAEADEATIRLASSNG